MKFARTGLITLGIAAALGIGAAHAGKYPEKSVTAYIPFPAGGESDVAARQHAKLFKEKFGHEMVVINKPGAGGALGWSQLNSMPADGYTTMGVNVPHIILQPLDPNTQYKTEDITPVYFFHYTPDAIVVRNESPYQTYADLVKAAKANPGKITLAGSGKNSANHMAHERFNKFAGVKTTYVPFKGTGDLTTAVLGGHVDGAMTYSMFAVQQKGKIRLLAIASEKRIAQYPDSPTFNEVGLKWVGGAYRGIAVPKGTPENVRKDVSNMMGAINKIPEFVKRMTNDGFAQVDIPYEQIGAFMKEQIKDTLEDAKAAGLIK